MMIISVTSKTGVQLACLVETGKVDEVRALFKKTDPECSPRLVVPLSVAQVVENLKEV